MFADYLKEEIYGEIDELIKHCKAHYMKNPDKFVDRHKVSAAVMIAILKNTPIKIAGSAYYSEKAGFWCFNEHLAITAALSVLVAFIREDIKDKYNGEKLNRELKKIENGIVFPSVKYGNYRDNWTNELYYMRKDGNYNLLALAHELFFLEYITMN